MFFSLAFVPSIAVAVIFDENTVGYFFGFFLVTFSAGLLLFASSKKDIDSLTIHDGFLVTVIFWVILGLFGSMPFIALIGLNPVDSLFESFSGITTTGATVLSGIENYDKSILIFRQLLQWIGGMGLIILAVAILPSLGIGGGQLFKMETPGSDNTQKITPRIRETAQALWRIYLALSILCFLTYLMAGMSSFDAIAHALSTVSIGGFSTYDGSIGYFNNISIEIVCIIFMLASAMSFALHYSALSSKSITKYFKNPELGFFFGVMLIIFGVGLCFLLFTSSNESFNFRSLVFQTVSMLTTSGFHTNGFDVFPLFVSFLLLIGAFIGACSGSVGGGIKSWRVLVMVNQVRKEIFKIIHPDAVVTSKIGNKVIHASIAEKVWGFFSIYVITFMLLFLGMLATGADFETAFSTVGACLNNLGPALGEATNNYESISSLGKTILIFAMVLGRLEIFTFLVVLAPSFWRK
jgi:trk system potassium uptake protein TrkH